MGNPQGQPQEQEQPQEVFLPPPLPAWLAGLGDILLAQEFGRAIRQPRKNLEKHFELAAEGLGIK
jgi:hypothetical protein